MAHDTIGLGQGPRSTMPLIGKGGVSVEGRNISLATVLLDLIRTPGVRMTLASYEHDEPSAGMPSGFRRLGPDLRTCTVEGLFTHATRCNLGLEVWELVERLNDETPVEIPRRYHLYRDGEGAEAVLHVGFPATEAGLKLRQKLERMGVIDEMQNGFYRLNLAGLKPVPTQWVSNLATVGIGNKLREALNLERAVSHWRDEYQEAFGDRPYVVPEEPRTVPRVCPEQRQEDGRERRTDTVRVPHITFSLVGAEPEEPSSLYGLSRKAFTERIIAGQRRVRALDVTIRCLAIAFRETLSHNPEATFGLKWLDGWVRVPRSHHVGERVFREALLPNGNRLCVTRWVGAK